MGPITNPIIVAENLGRTFRSLQKERGLRGALELVFHPKYKESVALKDVSFQVETGSFVGLIGANGAGKTTLLKILSGLIAPSAGRARVLGYDPFERKVAFRKQIALVMGQKSQLWWDLPALDAFDLLAAIYDIPASVYKNRLDELTSLLDVTRLLGTQIRRLSLGERMKMELIGAILHWPRLIYLDEPTIGLDVVAAHNLREFLKRHNEREGATILLTSHNMDDIERLCSRVLILRSGSLIYDSSPQGLTEKGSRVLQIRLRQTPSVRELALAAQCPEASVSLAEQEEAERGGAGAYAIALTTESLVPCLSRILSRFEVISMSIEEQTLESVIHRIYAQPTLPAGALS